MIVAPEHRAAIRSEMAIAAAGNAAFPTAVLWFAEKAPPETLLGHEGIIFSMLPAAGAAALVMTLLVTTIVRARVRKGILAPLVAGTSHRRAFRFIPDNLILRAAVLALLAIVLLVPPGLLIVAATDVLPMTRGGFAIFNIVFGVVVGLVMAPLIVLRALADTVQRRGLRNAI